MVNPKYKSVLPKGSSSIQKIRALKVNDWKIALKINIEWSDSAENVENVGN